MKRSHSIDILRGLVMVIMAIDHSRDFMTSTGLDPKDLTQVSVPLFLTRYVTNLCAPAFVFLAGLGSYLSFSSGKPKGELASFLLKRGLWLIFLELTIIRMGWMFEFSYGITELQVIWAIGWSMVALAALIYLPLRWIALISIAMIFGHNAFDGVRSESFGAMAWLWIVLHEPGTLFELAGRKVLILYPLVPWVGVMALGFSFGGLWRSCEPTRRARLCARIGACCLGAFLLLKAANVYGDPEPWSLQGTPLRSVLSFIKITKYPPSLAFLLITLGVTMLLLAAFERAERAESRFRALNTLGRVPMFYYLGHIYLTHLVAVAAAVVLYPGKLSHYNFIYDPPPGYGYGLGAAFLVWVLVVAVMFPLCSWYAEIKRRNRHPLLSYL